MKKKTIILTLILLFMGMSITQFMPNLMPLKIKAEPSQIEEVFYEDFNDPVPQNGWDFAHQNFFSTSTQIKREGSSLQVTPSPYGERYYDGVQYYQSFSHGSIEGWVYCKYTWQLYPSFWLRTTNIDSNDEYCSFDYGYAVYLYKDHIKLRAYLSGNWQPTYASYDLGSYIQNKWWHVKFEAIHNVLKVWISNSENLPANPQITYDLSNEGYIIKSGKAGISARTSTFSFYKTYFDEVTIRKISYIGDTINPNVLILDPLNGDTLEYPMNVQTYTSDNFGVAGVNFYLDGEFEHGDAIYPFEWSSDLRCYSEGTHTITAEAYDFSGNTKTYTITVTFNHLDAIVIVEEELWDSSQDLRDAITTYKQDLIAEGFDIIPFDETFTTAENLRYQLLIYHMAYDIDGIVLIGDLPYARFVKNDDIFICDLFLMDVDGTWTDSNSDGIYDSHTAETGDIEPEFFLGRIDASKRTYRKKIGSRDMTEIEEIIDLLGRIHSYRNGGISRTDRSLFFMDDDWSEYVWETWLWQAYSDHEEIRPPNGITTAANWMNQLTNDYEWAHLCAHSTPTWHGFSDANGNDEGKVTALDIHNIKPTFNFYNLFCCDAADYRENDCLAVTYLFSSDYSVAVIGSTKSGGMVEGYTFYSSIGTGYNLGYSLYRWFYAMVNNEDFVGWAYGMCILGDPFLTI